MISCIHRRVCKNYIYKIAISNFKKNSFRFFFLQRKSNSKRVRYGAEVLTIVWGKEKKLEYIE